MYFLRDLNKHCRAVEQADIVLISAGVNDLMKNAVSARLLHDHVRAFISRFPNTQFLFDSVTPLAMRADRFNLLNDTIERLNELMFRCSLHHKNFKLFDNLEFGLAHLTKDGLHLTHTGQSVMSSCWVNCILVRLGLRRGPLPIRRRYFDMARDSRPH